MVNFIRIGIVVSFLVLIGSCLFFANFASKEFMESKEEVKKEKIDMSTEEFFQRLDSVNAVLDYQNPVYTGNHSFDFKPGGKVENYNGVYFN